MHIIKFTIAFIIVAISFTNGHAQPKKSIWSLYGTDKNYLYFYDSLSVKKESKNNVTCWIKTMPIPDSLEKIRRVMIELNNPMARLKAGDKFNTHGYEKYAFLLQNIQIDCKKQRIMCLMNLDYDEEGTVLRDVTPNQAQWQKIVPGSVGGSLMEKFCKYVNEEK